MVTNEDMNRAVVVTRGAFASRVGTLVKIYLPEPGAINGIPYVDIEIKGIPLVTTKADRVDRLHGWEFLQP